MCVQFKGSVVVDGHGTRFRVGGSTGMNLV